MLKNIFILLLLVFCCSSAQSISRQDPLSLYYYELGSTAKDADYIIKNADFKPYPSSILNFGLGVKDYWIRTTIQPDLLKTDNLTLLIDQSRLLYAEVFYVKNGQILFKQHNKYFNLISSMDLIGNVNYFKIPKTVVEINPEIYIHIISNELFVVPVMIQDINETNSLLNNRNLIFGLYSGALLIMFVYNLFLYFSIRDRNYVFYVFYILFTWLTQISVQGFASKYFWSDSPWFHQHCVTIFSLTALLFGLYFTMSFLNTKTLVSRYHKILQFLFILASLNLVLSFTSYFSIAFVSMQFLTFASCIAALWIAAYVYFRKKFRPAGYYLLSWTTLVVGILLFLAKDYNIIPYNTTTIYILQIASIIEIVLLSFALADKINIFKKEKEESQSEALRILTENEKLVREQNVLLEIKVKERTEALENINHSLNDALSNLKETQSQLVDSEKMASLGQLTAGIAHEINNPINFVTSNIKPLQMDIDDLNELIDKYEQLDFNGDINTQLSGIESFKKSIDLNFVREEIKSLLSGIGEGAKRTAEIIRSLKNFSRLDENDTKPVDLNEGLDSTLVLLRSTFPSNLSIVKNYAELPKVECMPGKLNQVFMNLISNAIQAIKGKNPMDEQEQLTITTWNEDQQVKISIKDSGSGMTEEVKQKIFEPFFTTKDVGEGTGLGLSIVFRIIENHHGHIDVVTKVNQGTEFIITLPVISR